MKKSSQDSIRKRVASRMKGLITLLLALLLVATAIPVMPGMRAEAAENCYWIIAARFNKSGMLCVGPDVSGAYATSENQYFAVNDNRDAIIKSGVTAFVKIGDVSKTNVSENCVISTDVSTKLYCGSMYSASGACITMKLDGQKVDGANNKGSGDANKGVLNLPAGNYQLECIPTSDSTIEWEVNVKTLSPPKEGEVTPEVDHKDNTPETTMEGVSKDLALAVANPQEQAALGDKLDAVFTLEVTNADNTVSSAEKNKLEEAAKKSSQNAVLGMILDLKMWFQVGNLPKRQLSTLNGNKVKIKFKVPGSLKAPAGTKRTFIILQNHNDQISEVARTTADEVSMSVGDFSTYALAYVDEGGDNTAVFNTSIKVKQQDGKIKVSWDRVEGVSKVDVFATYCGSKFSSSATKKTTGTSVKIKKIKGKAIDFTKNFKFYLVAYDSNGKKLGESIIAHIAGKDSAKYTNVKSIKLKIKSISVAKGQSVAIKASIKLADKTKKQFKKHAAKFRYSSTNTSVATVDAKGNVTGVSAGTCEVYVYAKNGLAKKVGVTVTE